MKVLITQPRYLPNPDYLKRIIDCDLWVILDDVQRNSRVFENRNYIGVDKQMLTIPIIGSSRQLISNMVAPYGWRDDHINKISEKYKMYDHYKDLLHKLYRANFSDRFIDICLHQLKIAFEVIGENFPQTMFSSEISNKGKGKDLIFDVLKEVNATEYLSGIACLDYGIDKKSCSEKNIKLSLYSNSENMPWLHYFFTEDVFSLGDKIDNSIYDN